MCWFSCFAVIMYNRRLPWLTRSLKYINLGVGNHISSKEDIPSIFIKLKTGAIFGELSWVGKRPRTTSVIADGDVIALKLNFESVESLGPALAKKI